MNDSLPPKRRNLVLLILGLLLGIAAFADYFIFGYSLKMLLLFLGSLVITGGYFAKNRGSVTASKPLDRHDAFVILLLLILLGPLYIAYNYTIPWQVNVDELTLSNIGKYLIDQENPDPFGLSYYWNFPNLSFLTMAILAETIGEGNLKELRFINGAIGLLTVILSYLLFRAHLPKISAAGAAVLLGTNHAMIAVSRVAMWNNTGLLIEIAALALLFRGFIKRDRFYTFLGGMVTGISLYVYFTARLTLVIWFLFLGLVLIFPRRTITFKEVVMLSLITMLGFSLVAAPNIAAMLKTTQSNDYSKAQLLIFSSGRKAMQDALNTNTTAEAVKLNIFRGLLTFNKDYTDFSWGNYWNVGHGFVDALTGILIWLGLLLVFSKFFRSKEATHFDLLMVASFMFLWLFFTFVVNRAPSFFRLIVILPAVAYFVMIGLHEFTTLIGNHFGPKRSPSITSALFVILIILIAGWNLLIYWDFVKKGFADGNEVGATVRYIDARGAIPNYTFFLMANETYRYYYFGDKNQWKEWLGFSVPKNQGYEVVAPEEITSVIEEPPFTIFTNRDAWHLIESQIGSKYVDLRSNNMTTDGRLLAIEVLR